MSDTAGMQHTQEPWHTGGDGTIIYDRDGWGIASATVFHGRREPETSRTNARRIVACVNACAGIPTALLEVVSMPVAAGALRPALGTLADVQELLPVGVKVREAGPNIIELYSEHLQQRDRLLAVLENLLNRTADHTDCGPAGSGWRSDDLQKAFNDAAGAIAECGGA